MDIGNRTRRTGYVVGEMFDFPSVPARPRRQVKRALPSNAAARSKDVETNGYEGANVRKPRYGRDGYSRYIDG